MFKNSFSFEGRIRRLEYGLSYIITVAALVILNITIIGLSGADYGREDSNSAMLFLILAIPVYWFLFAQGAKRCHDRNNSGWWQLIPFYGLWMLFADGEPGPNEYGPNPKGIGNIDEIEELGSHLVK